MMVHGSEQNAKAYVSDFGLACTVNHYHHPDLAMPPQWPPETRPDPHTRQFSAQFSFAADVYCFGWTLTEVSYWSEFDAADDDDDCVSWDMRSFVAAFLHSGAAIDSPEESDASAVAGNLLSAEQGREVGPIDNAQLLATDDMGGIGAEMAHSQEKSTTVTDTLAGAAAAAGDQVSLGVSSEGFYDPLSAKSVADGGELRPSEKRAFEFYDPTPSDGRQTKRSRSKTDDGCNPHRAHIQNWLCSAKKSYHLLPHPWLPYLVSWCTDDDAFKRPSIRMVTCLMKLAVQGAPLSTLPDLFLSDACVSAAPDAAADWDLLSLIVEATPSQQAIAWPSKSSADHCVRAVSRLMMVCFLFFVCASYPMI
jgi:hypothetical protein